MAKYRLTNQALKDLNDIWSYTYMRWSVDQADKYYNLIINEFESIVANPLSGKSIDHIKEGYRSSQVKSHLVFYRIMDNTIEIVRILHQRMDIADRMK